VRNRVGRFGQSGQCSRGPRAQDALGGTKQVGGERRDGGRLGNGIETTRVVALRGIFVCIEQALFPGAAHNGLHRVRVLFENGIRLGKIRQEWNASKDINALSTKVIVPVCDSIGNRLVLRIVIGLHLSRVMHCSYP
jgi:hypothetical protein